MKFVVAMITTMLMCNGVSAATAYWRIRLSDGGSYCGANVYIFGGSVHGEDEKYAGILANIYGHMEDGKLYLKHYDFSLESMNPTFNWWALAHYGEVVGEDTFNSLSRIEDFVGDDYCTGGTLIENPSDFYMAFKACESVFVTGVGEVPGQAWYGWVHVSVDDSLEMTLIDEGVNLYGGPVVVGAIPEPSAWLLLFLGLAGLALRRRDNAFKGDR